MLSSQIIFFFPFAFLLSYILTPQTIRLCHTLGADDKPDGERKINTLPIPRLGGLAFFSSFFIFAVPLAAKDPTVAAILSGGAILVAGGFADDVFNLSPKLKLLIQISASLVAITIAGSPETLSFFGVFDIHLSGLIGASIVIFKMIFTTNAVNFSDGLDGLAAGLSVVAFTSLFIYGMINGRTYPAFASLLLATAVIGFLPYNKYRAKTFMGDSGSQFLGFAFALLSLGCAKENAYTLEATLFLAIPALDTALSVPRRLIKKKSPFSADKGHLHHVLLKSGVSHPASVRILISLNALVAFATLIIISYA